MRFKIDWASLIVGRKFTVFSLFYLIFEGNFQVQAPGRAYIWRGDLTDGFLRFEFGGGGAYIWRGLYMERLIFGILRYMHTAELVRMLQCCNWCCFIKHNKIRSEWVEGNDALSAYEKYP